MEGEGSKRFLGLMDGKIPCDHQGAGMIWKPIQSK